MHSQLKKLALRWRRSFSPFISLSSMNPSPKRLLDSLLVLRIDAALHHLRSGWHQAPAAEGSTWKNDASWKLQWLAESYRFGGIPSILKVNSSFTWRLYESAILASSWDTNPYEHGVNASGKTFRPPLTLLLKCHQNLSSSIAAYANSPKDKSYLEDRFSLTDFMWG